MKEITVCPLCGGFARYDWKGNLVALSCSRHGVFTAHMSPTHVFTTDDIIINEDEQKDNMLFIGVCVSFLAVLVAGLVVLSAILQ